MSPRRPDPAVRSQLLAAARDLFLERGYAATGTEEICTAAGVTKGALYHHWRSKRELALDVLSEWTRAGFQAYSAAPFLASPTAIDRVFGYVDFTIELSQLAPLGCLLGTIVQETSQSEPALRQRCEGAFRDWAAGLATLLEEARREVGASFDAEAVARHFVAVFEGAQLMAKASGSKAVVREHLTHFRTYLGLLLGVLPSEAQARKNVRADSAHPEDGGDS